MKRNQKKGQGLVEYVLLISLLALVCVAVLTGMGQNIGGTLFGNIATNLDQASSNISSSP